MIVHCPPPLVEVKQGAELPLIERKCPSTPLEMAEYCPWYAGQALYCAPRAAYPGIPSVLCDCKGTSASAFRRDANGG
jgi:hypothetical protein